MFLLIYSINTKHPGTNLFPQTILFTLYQDSVSFKKLIRFSIILPNLLLPIFPNDLIIKSLGYIPNIQYLLFGPAETKIPKHHGIIHCGPIEHQFVPSIMSMADTLVMPFKISELVRSVDPVKVYEYICSGKPALVVGYEET